ncbi:MAG: hypothetical protein V7K47_12775 [Nostoc sp.]
MYYTVNLSIFSTYTKNPFSLDDEGRPDRRSLQQAHDYMRLIYKKITKATMKILDHSPALELLLDPSGAAAKT